MRIFIALILLTVSLNAKETWHLELKDGTIFTLKQRPANKGKVYEFTVNGQVIQVEAKSVASLTTREPLLDRFLYSEYEGKKATEEQTRKAVVRVESELHRGSGTIIHPEGYILTNNHLVSNNHELTATLHNGEKHKLEIVAKSSLFDLAVLKIANKGDKDEQRKFPFVRFDDERKLTDKSKVYTYSTAAQRPWKKVATERINSSEYFGREDGILYQQYRMKMRPDDTGSPLFDENGSLVGIVTQKTKSVHSQNIWFSTPVSFVKTVMKNINSYIHNPSNSPIRYNKIDKK